MARDEHLSKLSQGLFAWNKWRLGNPQIRVDLSGTDLRRSDLIRVDLRGADLIRADLRGADLIRADLRDADLIRADLRDADLSGADLSGADLSGADLSGADLNWVSFIVTDLSGADLSGAMLAETIFVNIDLTNTNGLDKCCHFGPSSIDFSTLMGSKNLPFPFLRGCGLPEHLIEYLPSLRGVAFQFHSCFIIYSAKDEIFAKRLHADMQAAGVRCWFAPHDLPIGAKTWDDIDEAIKLQHKLLVILSEASIGSDWVEDEVTRAYAEERDRNVIVLFPVRIDDAVMNTPEPWARKLRDQRNIGDFRQWESGAQYAKSFERLLRDLKATIDK